MSRSDQKSPSEAERGVTDARAELQDTIEELQGRLAPGALFEDALAYFSGDGRRYTNTILHEAKANPFPVMLIGIGLAWLAIGSGRRIVGPDQDHDRQRDPAADELVTSKGSFRSDRTGSGNVGIEPRPDSDSRDRVGGAAVPLTDLGEKPKPETATRQMSEENAGTAPAAGAVKPSVGTSRSTVSGAPFDPSESDADGRKRGDPVVTSLETEDGSRGHKGSAKDAKI